MWGQLPRPNKESNPERCKAVLLRRQAPCDQQNEEMQQRADEKAIAYRAEVETRVVRTVEVSVRPDGRQQEGYAPSLTDLEPD